MSGWKKRGRAGTSSSPAPNSGGALPGDKVELTVLKEKDGLESGEITRIHEMGSPLYAGIVRKFGLMASVELPGVWDGDLPLKGADEAENGERVLVEILRRGESHRDYQARLMKRYGDGDMAVHCAQSILEAAGIVREFPEEAVREAKFLAGRGILPEELDGRLDLREEVIFTIDGAESKDLDDAVSIRETGNGFSPSASTSPTSPTMSRPVPPSTGRPSGGGPASTTLTR